MKTFPLPVLDCFTCILRQPGTHRHGLNSLLIKKYAFSFFDKCLVVVQSLSSIWFFTAGVFTALPLGNAAETGIALGVSACLCQLPDQM